MASRGPDNNLIDVMLVIEFTKYRSLKVTNAFKTYQKRKYMAANGKETEVSNNK